MYIDTNTLYHEQQAAAGNYEAPGIVGPEQNGLTQGAGHDRPGYSEGKRGRAGRAVGEPTSSSLAASSSSQPPPAETEVVGPRALCPDRDERAIPIAHRCPGRPLSEQWGLQEAPMTMPFAAPFTSYSIHTAFVNGYDMGSQQVWNQQAQGNNWCAEEPSPQHRPSKRQNRGSPSANEGGCPKRIIRLTGIIATFFFF